MKNRTASDWVKIAAVALLITLICQASLWSLVATWKFIK